MQPFIKLLKMKWFLEADKVEAVLKEDVETRPEALPDAILNVDIFLIRFFSSNAWLLVTVRVKKEKHAYICKTCYHDLHERPSVLV